MNTNTYVGFSSDTLNVLILMTTPLEGLSDSAWDHKNRTKTGLAINYNNCLVCVGVCKHVWVCITYFLANRLLSLSSISLSVEEDGVVLADVLTGDAGGSTFTAVPTFGALATLCKPSRLWAPGGAKWLPSVMHETSIWLMELCRRLRLLSPTKFNMNTVLDNC